MMTQFEIEKLSQRFQTTQQNVRREYVQHLFLSNFYKQKGSDYFLFKGGTALRIVFNSPRFSEDLDFSAEVYKTKVIEDIIVLTLGEMEKTGIKTKINEAKETTGGYFADINFELEDSSLTVLLQFSKRKTNDQMEVVSIVNDFVIPYTVCILKREQLFNEKIQALLTRSKPRDFYDIYFLIRSNLINESQKKLLIQVKDKLSSSKINFNSELKQFLPISYSGIIKNFNQSLQTELDKFVR